MDGHWSPAWSWCQVCDNSFDYVIKLEEQPLEIWYLLEKIGLWHKRGDFIDKVNYSVKLNNISSDQIMDQNLKLLRNNQRSWINNYFHQDFLLFQYEKLRLIDV